MENKIVEDKRRELGIDIGGGVSKQSENFFLIF